MFFFYKSHLRKAYILKPVLYKPTLLISGPKQQASLPNTRTKAPPISPHCKQTVFTFSGSTFFGSKVERL